MDTHYAVYVDQISKAELHEWMTLYGDDVWRYAYAITGDGELAKDIAQEVFIKAYSNVHTFRGQSSLKTWLLSITRNMAINERRSSYVKRVVLFEWVKPPRDNPSAELDYFKEQDVRELWQIVFGLPSKLREVLVLKLDQDLTVAETARLLQISEGTVKSRLHRARAGVTKKWRERER